MKNKILLIDLDGVLNTYEKNYQENVIPEPRTGTKDFLEDIFRLYKIKIFTTRNPAFVEVWLKNNCLDNYISGITNYKEPCFAYIDDRCINFDGNYIKLKDKIVNFKPYYKID